MKNKNNTIRCVSTWLKARELMQSVFDDLLVRGQQEAAGIVSRYLTTMDGCLDEYDKEMELWRLTMEKEKGILGTGRSIKPGEAIRARPFGFSESREGFLTNEDLMDMRENTLRSQGLYPEVMSEEEFQNFLTLEAEKDNQRY